MYLEIIKLMKDSGIKFDAGLIQSELEKIYRRVFRMRVTCI